jgi:polar amino acid transport system ATP-binding protein
MRDGVVAECGPPGVVIDNPQQESTRAFLGRFKASSEATSSGSNSVVAAVA